MKKVYFLLIIVFLGVQSADAQFFKNAKKMLNSGNRGLTEKDAADGIKEALVNGTGESVKLVSVINGYWGNPEIKIPFPPEAKEMELKLRTLGMAGKVDEFNESMNRAAEKAATEAKPIFIAAIKAMTVKDAINIVKGSDNAATTYLKNTTSPELIAKFQPVIKTSLDNVNATRYWSDLITLYNKIPLVKKMNPNLTEYVTQKAIDGLFIMIAKEELKIREGSNGQNIRITQKSFWKLKITIDTVLYAG